MTQQVLILGAGFGGLELATMLSDSLRDEVQVTLVDQNDSFIFGFSKLEILFGRRTRDELRCSYRDISKPGVAYRQELVTSIDPATRQVITDGNRYQPDILVVALGADYDLTATPGFEADGYEYYSVAGAERLRDVLQSFSGGRVLIAVLGVPFKCPPAPYEGALLLQDYLLSRGVRDATQIDVISTMESPIPVSPETSEAIVQALAERAIGYTPGRRVRGLDPRTHRAQLKTGEIPYELFIGIPVHRAPAVVEASGLTRGGTDGWIAVNPRNLATPFPNVYALGDCADAPVPRAGAFAESAARAVADDIAAKINASGPSRPTTAPGRATSSSVAAWWARSTPTSCPVRRRQRLSWAPQPTLPLRRRSSPMRGGSAGSVAESRHCGPKDPDYLRIAPLPRGTANARFARNG